MYFYYIGSVYNSISLDLSPDQILIRHSIRPIATGFQSSSAFSPCFPF